MADARSQSADRFVCLGDLAFRGPQPAECLERVRGLERCTVIAGNTDQWVTGDLELPEDPAQRTVLDPYRSFARERLDADALDWLTGLPFAHEQTVGDESLYFVHAGPHSTMDHFPADLDEKGLTGIWEGAPESAAALIYGHIHVPFVRRVAGRYVINAGSVGLPFDGDPRASYLLIETDGSAVGWQLRRVPYDIAAASSEAERRGMPAASDYAATLRAGRLAP